MDRSGDRTNRISGRIAYEIKCANQGLLWSERLEMVAFTEMGNTRGRNRFMGRYLFVPCYILNGIIHPG